MNSIDLRLARTLAMWSCAAAVLSVAVGCAVLGGWFWDVAAIKSVLPGLPTMKANTAICFVLAGLSLLLWQFADRPVLASPRRLRRAALGCAAAATLIAVATLGEYLFDWNAGIDELLVRDLATAAPEHPGRMSMASAITFVLLGSALLLTGSTHRTGFAQGLAAAAVVVSLTALLAYLLHADLQRAPWFDTVAVHTAATFLVLGTGVMNLRTQHGWMRAFVLDTLSSRLGRRFLAGTLLILPLLAAIQVLGQRNLDLYGPYFAIAMLAASSMTLLSLLNWFSTRMGNDAEERLSHQNRLYATLSGINTLIVRVRSREELFSEACLIANVTGRVPWVWIATVDGRDHSTRLVASHGGNDAIRDDLKRRLSSNPGTVWDDTLVRRAIATKAPVIVNDIASGPGISDDDRMRNAELLTHGIRALVLLPLIVSGETVGIFALHSDEVDFFDEQEMKLLTELAGDISLALDNIEKNETLDYLAYYDPVTGLANRTLFLERLGRELNRKSRDSEKVALVLGDLKRFRMINESFGRSASDELLKQVAARLRQYAQHPENLARLAGDCFATFIPITRHASVAAHRIEGLMGAALGTPFTLGTHNVSVEATLGIAVFPTDGADAEILVRNAEAALKEAKEQSEPYLFYKPELNAQVAESLQLENRLREAIELGQFVLHYQPKVDCGERTVASVEALIRWNDPQSGMVPPGRFIGLLEETGLIKQVGHWALHQAVADCRRWTSMGLRAPRCAVNVSPVQLRDPRFVNTVVEALEGFDDAEPLLDIELTESLVMENITENSAALMTLRGVGVQVAVDDFGTGYSSLAYLARLPINALKIDRAFIHAMVESREGRTIVGSIISLAHSLRLEVIAEGVETEQQADALLAMGCDLMQGHLISKPVPFEQLAAMLPEARGQRARTRQRTAGTPVHRQSPAQAELSMRCDRGSRESSA